MIEMPVVEIRSGGQSGADTAGLVAGKALGLKTGGMAPKGFRTEVGDMPELGSEYGLTESTFKTYPERTEHNVKTTDGTVLFGDASSPGSGATIRFCKRHEKPYKVIPYPLDEDIDMTQLAATFQQWLVEHHIQILNVAGNRESKNPGVGQFAYEFLMLALGGEQESAG